MGKVTAKAYEIVPYKTEKTNWSLAFNPLSGRNMSVLKMLKFSYFFMLQAK